MVRVYGSGFRFFRVVNGLRSRVQGTLGFRVEGFGFNGLGFRFRNRDCGIIHRDVSAPRWM